VIELVKSKRIIMPKIGTRKLYYLLKEYLKELGVGRDKLFKILRANRLLIKPKKNITLPQTLIIDLGNIKIRLKN